MSGVSFRISAPGPSAPTAGRSNGRARRYSSESGSSDDEDGLDRRSRRQRDESITAIDDRGIRSSSVPKKAAPLVIQSAPNKDFRRAAIELRAKKQGKSQFLPNQVGQLTGEDGKKRRELTEAEKEFLASSSNVQRVGDKVVQGGISVRQRKEDVRIDDRADTPVGEREPTPPQTNGNGAQHPIDEDALALKELLGDKGETGDGPKVHIIPQAEDHVTEDDAYAIDVATRPDVPTLDDYARVPIDDFGAALLRGMGGGNAAQKRKREKVEAYVPKARSALLGLGAKSREEAFGKEYVKEADKGLNKRDTMRFVPLQKVERPSASPAPLPSTSDRHMLEDGKAASSSSRRRDDERDHQRSSRRDDEDRRRDIKRNGYLDDSDEERERRRRRKERERDRDRDRDSDYRRRRDKDGETNSDRKRHRERSRSADRDRRDRYEGRPDKDDRDRRR